MSARSATLDIEIAIAPRKGRDSRRQSRPEEHQPTAPPQIPRIARLTALAIKFQDMVERGEVRDYADLARLGYVTRARVTQIMNLLHLAPDIQEQLLLLAPITKVVAQPLVERQIRLVASVVDWCEQKRRWKGETQSSAVL